MSLPLLPLVAARAALTPQTVAIGGASAAAAAAAIKAAGSDGDARAAAASAWRAERSRAEGGLFQIGLCATAALFRPAAPLCGVGFRQPFGSLERTRGTQAEFGTVAPDGQELEKTARDLKQRPMTSPANPPQDTHSTDFPAEREERRDTDRGFVLDGPGSPSTTFPVSPAAPVLMHSSTADESSEPIEVIPTTPSVDFEQFGLSEPTGEGGDVFAGIDLTEINDLSLSPQKLKAARFDAAETLRHLSDEHLNNNDIASAAQTAWLAARLYESAFALGADEQALDDAGMMYGYSGEPEARARVWQRLKLPPRSVRDNEPSNPRSKTELWGSINYSAAASLFYAEAAVNDLSLEWMAKGAKADVEYYAKQLRELNAER